MRSVRCLLAAICCEKGDVAANLAAHLDLIAQAAAEGCQLAVFPEMSLPDWRPGVLTVDVPLAGPGASPSRLLV